MPFRPLSEAEIQGFSPAKEETFRPLGEDEITSFSQGTGFKPLNRKDKQEAIKDIWIDKAIDYSEKKGLRPDVVVALMNQESKISPIATSPTGVKGLLQVTLATGRKYKPELKDNERYDPDISLDLGTSYLADLLKEKGNYPDAIFAYNGGSDPKFKENVAKHLGWARTHINRRKQAAMEQSQVTEIPQSDIDPVTGKTWKQIEDEWQPAPGPRVGQRPGFFETAAKTLGELPTAAAPEAPQPIQATAPVPQKITSKPVTEITPETVMAGAPEAGHIEPIGKIVEQAAAAPFIPLDWAVSQVGKRTLRPTMEYAFPKATKEELDMAEHGLEFAATLGLIPTYFKGIQKGLGWLSDIGRIGYYRHAPDVVFKSRAVTGLPAEAKPLSEAEMARVNEFTKARLMKERATPERPLTEKPLESAPAPAQRRENAFQDYLLKTGAEGGERAGRAQDLLAKRGPNWVMSPSGLEEISRNATEVKHFQKDLGLIFARLHPEQSVRPDEIWQHLTPEDLQGLEKIPRAKELLNRIQTAATLRMAEAKDELLERQSIQDEKDTIAAQVAAQKEAEAQAKEIQKQVEAQAKEAEKQAQAETKAAEKAKPTLRKAKPAPKEAEVVPEAEKAVPETKPSMVYQDETGWWRIRGFEDSEAHKFGNKAEAEKVAARIRPTPETPTKAPEPAPVAPVGEVKAREVFLRPWKQTSILLKNQHPFLTIEGEITNPWDSHLEATKDYLIPGQRSENMGAYMRDTGSIRLKGEHDSLSVEFQKPPTTAQFSKIKEMAGGRPIYWDLSNDQMKIQKSGHADNFREFQKQIRTLPEKPSVKPPESPPVAPVGEVKGVGRVEGEVAPEAIKIPPMPTEVKAEPTPEILPTEPVGKGEVTAAKASLSKLTGKGTGYSVRLLPEDSTLYRKYSKGESGLEIYHITGKGEHGRAQVIAIGREQAQRFLDTGKLLPEEERLPTVKEKEVKGGKVTKATLIRKVGPAKTEAFAPEVGFRRKPEETKETEKPIGRKEMADFIREKMDIPLRVGKYRGFGRRTLGIFKTKEEVIRTKFANDIEAIAHEIGHALQKYLWPGAITPKGSLSSRAFMKIGKGIYAELNKLAYPGAKKKLTEGFAEFIRLYITNEAMARNKAPQFYDYFEDILGKKSPEAKEILLDSRKQFNRWITQTPEERIKAQISQGELTQRPPLTMARLYHSLVDELAPIQKVVKEISQGKQIGIGKDPYKLMRLLPGWTGKADTFLEYRTMDFATHKWKGKSLKDILAPIADELEEFQTYIVAKRAIELHGRRKETGILPEDAESVVAKYDKKYGKFFDELKQYQDDCLKYLRDSGVLGIDSYLKIKKLNQDYVPFYRLVDLERGPGRGGTYKPGQPIKRLKGSWLNIIDPLESIVKNTYLFINAAEKNAAMNALVNLAEGTEGAGKYVEKIPPAMQRTTAKLSDVLTSADMSNLGLTDADPLTEKVVSIFRPSAFTPKGNVIAVFKDGKRTFYEVAPEIYRVVEGMDRAGIEVLEKLMGRPLTRMFTLPAKLLRLGATTLSPEFVLRNPFRDQWTAYIYSKYGYKPPFDFPRGVFHIAKRTDLYWQYKASGADQTMLVSTDREYLQKTLQDMLDSTSTKGIFKYIIRHPFEGLKILSELGEIATRIGEFRKGLVTEGSTKEAMQTAALASREVTLDFARKGAKGKVVNTLVAFWNANVQGMDKMVREFRENPWATSWKVALSITIPSIILAAINYDDPRYKELPQWEKDVFWHVLTKNHIFRIPKPFELGLIFGSMPQRATEYILSKDPHAFDKIIESFGRGFSPGLIPTVLLPIVENWSNYSTFFDRPIVPRGQEDLLPKYQYGRYTSETAKILATLMAKLPVINETGAASPAKIDNLIRGWTGGFGKLVTNALDVGMEKSGIINVVPRPAKTLSDIPGIRAFVSRYPTAQAKSITRFYDDYTKANSIFLSLRDQAKKGEIPETRELLEALKKAPPLNDHKKSIDNIRKAMKLVEQNPDMTPNEKRETLDKFTLMMIQIAQKGNELMDKIRLRNKN